MEDSKKLQHLSLEDLENVAGGETLSDKAVASVPKAAPGGVCPYCGMKIATSICGTSFTNHHRPLGFSNVSVWLCENSDLDYTLFRE